MFTLIAGINIIISVIMFAVWKDSGYKNIESLCVISSSVFNFILCLKLESIETRSKRNEEELNELKAKLNLPDSVSKNKDNENQQNKE